LDISFRNESLQALCNSKAALRRTFGPKRGRMVAQRLQELEALDCLAGVRHLPHVHVSVDDKVSVVAVRVDDGLDVHVVPSGDSSGAAWEEATEATVVAIFDDTGSRRSGRSR
jgi:hypothetical protein